MRRGLRRFWAAESLEVRRFLAVAGEVVLFDFEDAQLHDEKWLLAQPVGTAAPYVSPKGDSGNDLLKLAPGEGRNGSNALLVESPDKAAGMPAFWVLKNQSGGGRLESLLDESGYLAPRDNPVNRLSFWIRFEDGFRKADGADPTNIQNFVVGTYHFDPGKIGTDRVVESDNWHFYYQLVLRHDLAGGEWIHVVLNTTPTHQRSLSGEREAVDPTQPRGSMWDLATRFYLDISPYFDDPEKEYPVRMWVDDISLFYEPDPYQIEVRLDNYMEGEFVDAPVEQMKELPVRVTNRGTEPVSGQLVLAARSVVGPVLLDPLTQKAPGTITLAPGETREFQFRVTPRANTAGQTHGSGVVFIPSAEARPGSYAESSPYLRVDQYYGVMGPPDATIFGAWVKIVSQAPRENHIPRIQGGLTVQTGPDRVAKLQLDGRDADGDQVTYQLRSQSPRGGRVSLNPETGVATFVPDEDFRGLFKFNYAVSDGKQQSADARSWFWVDGNLTPPLDPSGMLLRNDRALVQLATGAIRAEGNVISNDEGGGATLQVVQVDGRKDFVGAKAPGSYGDFYIQPDGRFEYRILESLPSVQTLGLGQFLTDSISYEVSNGVDARAAIVRVTIEGRNHEPYAWDDSNLVARGIVPNETRGSVLANDIDPDGDALQVAMVGGTALSSGPAAAETEVPGAHGAFFFRADGTYRYVLDNRLPAVAQLAEGELLEDVVLYRVSDGVDSAQASLKVIITAPASSESRTPTSVYSVLDFEDTKLHDEPWLLKQPQGTAAAYIRPLGNASVKLAEGAGRQGSNAVLVESVDASQGVPGAFVMKNIKGARTIASLTDDRGYLLPRGQRANRLEFWVRFEDRLRQMYQAEDGSQANLRIVTYHYDPATVSTRVVESDNWSFTHDLQVRFDEAGGDWVRVVLAPHPDAQRNNPNTGWNPTASLGQYWELLTRFSVELLPPPQVDPTVYPLQMWIDDVALSYVPEPEQVEVQVAGFLPGQLVAIPRLFDRSFLATIKNSSDKPARGILRPFASSSLIASVLDPVTQLPWGSTISLAPGEVREAIVRLSVLPGMTVNSTGLAGLEYVALEEMRSANRSQSDWRVIRPAGGELVSPADAPVVAATIRVRATAAAENSRPTVLAGQVLEAVAEKPLNGQLMAVDPEADAVRFALEAQPEGGRLELDPDTGRFVFTPAPGFLGTTRFKYTALDAGGASRAGVSWIRVDEKTLEPQVPGDANRDGLFDTTDLVLVFQAGKYEDGIEGGTKWEEGDWNGDGEFDTADLVAAFQGGRFEVPPAARPLESVTAGWPRNAADGSSSGGDALQADSAVSGTRARLGEDRSTDGTGDEWIERLAAFWATRDEMSKKSTRSAISATDAFFSRPSAPSDL